MMQAAAQAHAQAQQNGGELPPIPYNDEPVEPIVNNDDKVGRNDACPCGSGKKYKQCCGRNS